MREKIIDFSAFSSIKIGGKTRVLVVDSVDDLAILPKNSIIIGRANNLLVSPSAQNLAMLGGEFNYIKEVDGVVEVGARTASGAIFSYFKRQNLGGLEFLNALPGSLGGLIKMNAGMKNYEIGALVDSVLVYENSTAAWHSDIKFSYRNAKIKGAILAARLKKIAGFSWDLVESFRAMRASHPTEPSAGSAFKNPPGDFAGRILEEIGLKGFRIGDAAFSSKHANFLVNLGRATFTDALELLTLAQTRTKSELGINLELEIKIVN